MKRRGYLVNRVRGQTQSFISIVYKSRLNGVLNLNPLQIVQKNSTGWMPLLPLRYERLFLPSRSYNYIPKNANCPPISGSVIGVNDYYISKAAKDCHDFQYTHHCSCMAYRSTMSWKIIGVNLVGILRTACFLVFPHYSIT